LKDDRSDLKELRPVHIITVAPGVTFPDAPPGLSRRRLYHWVRQRLKQLQTSPITRDRFLIAIDGDGAFRIPASVDDYWKLSPDERARVAQTTPTRACYKPADGEILISEDTTSEELEEVFKEALYCDFFTHLPRRDRQRVFDYFASTGRSKQVAYKSFVALSLTEPARWPTEIAELLKIVPDKAMFAYLGN
jgi:hypothetical protein